MDSYTSKTPKKGTQKKPSAHKYAERYTRSPMNAISRNGKSKEGLRICFHLLTGKISPDYFLSVFSRTFAKSAILRAAKKIRTKPSLDYCQFITTFSNWAERWQIVQR